MVFGAAEEKCPTFRVAAVPDLVVAGIGVKIVFQIIAAIDHAALATICVAAVRERNGVTR